jgi:hypothetical protein
MAVFPMVAFAQGGPPMVTEEINIAGLLESNADQNLSWILI